MFRYSKPQPMRMRVYRPPPPDISDGSSLSEEEDEYDQGGGDDEEKKENSATQSLVFKIHPTKHLVKKAKPNDDEDDKNNANNTDNALVVLTKNPTWPNYCELVDQANAEWPNKKKAFRREHWRLSHYFPTPPELKGAKKKLSEVEDWDHDESETEDDEYHWRLKYEPESEAYRQKKRKQRRVTASVLCKWGWTLRGYYGHLKRRIAKERALFHHAMTSTQPEVISTGYSWPYRHSKPPQSKVVPHFRQPPLPTELEGVYYCSPCDRFVPCYERHEPSTEHPHHAMCWCLSCTARYDRMMWSLREVLTWLAKSPFLKKFAEGVEFEDQIVDEPVEESDTSDGNDGDEGGGDKKVDCANDNSNNNNDDGNNNNDDGSNNNDKNDNNNDNQCTGAQ